MTPGLPLLVDAGKRNLSSVIEWGRRKMLDGAYEAAIQHFTDALYLKPGLIHALVSRGFCHLTLGEEDKAQRDFAEVIAKDAGFNRNVYVLIALCFKRHGEYHTAIRYLSRCVQQFASFKPALVARGELSLKVREYDKARMDFRQVLDDSPSHLVARRGLGDALRGLGNFRESLRSYSKAIEDALQELARHRSRVEASAMEHEGSGNGSEEAGNSSGSRASVPRGHRLASSGTDSIEEVHQGDGEGVTLPLEDGSDDESSGQHPPQYAGSPEYDDECGGTHERDEGVEVGDGSGSGSGRVRPKTPDHLVQMQDEPVNGPAQIQAFVTEVQLRRALLLRLTGDLEGAGADLLEVLQGDPQNGLALFWYAKILIETNRHREAPAFLQACLHHFEEARAQVHALLGALFLTRPDPDCEAALRQLNQAARLVPASQTIRVTQWICAAAASLQCTPRDPQHAVSLLDKALASLSASEKGSRTDRSSGRTSPAGPTGGNRARSPMAPVYSARGPTKTPRQHAAGSGGNAAAALHSLNGLGHTSVEEVTWSTARVLVQRRQELAQGDDLELALECTTYLQLVAREPQQQISAVPPLLHSLRAMALCDLGRWEDSLADCRRALAIDPEDEATQYNMHIASGIIKSKVAEYEASVGRFTKAIRLRPVSTEVRVHRAIALACAARASGNGAHASTGSPGREGSLSRDSGRVEQLLSDALKDLEAAEQQALIAGSTVPAGTGRLRAACLCGLGRPDEAWEVLQRGRGLEQGRGRGNSFNGPPSPRQQALEAEVLVLLERHREAVEVCTSILNTESNSREEEAGKPVAPINDRSEHRMKAVQAHIMRGRCWSELGEPERAFEDFREALVLAPERADGHEASGDLFLAHGCYNEAIDAYNVAAKLSGALSTRLAYARALTYFALGNAAAALKDFNKALRLNPHMPAAGRARDGAAALNMALEGDYRHAHVRLNVLLHPRSGSLGAGIIGAPGPDGLPPLFLPHELVLYRGVCSFYMGDHAAASQDFEAALTLARQMSLIEAPNLVNDHNQQALPSDVTCESHEGGRGVHGALEQPRRRAPPEVASKRGMDAFECEMQFNITLCYLLGKDYRGAQASCERLLAHWDALAALGPSAQCLVWFLIGVCRLALGEGNGDVAREAFMHSYAHDPVYVDDFLRRHEPTADRGTGQYTAGSNLRVHMGGGRFGGPPPQTRPVVSSALPGARAPYGRDACDAAPEAVCCIRRDRNRLSARFPPCRLQVKDVVIWARPSVGWPFVRTPELAPAANLARLDLLGHHEVGVNPAPPWDRFG